MDAPGRLALAMIYPDKIENKGCRWTCGKLAGGVRTACLCLSRSSIRGLLLRKTPRGWQVDRLPEPYSNSLPRRPPARAMAPPLPSLANTEATSILAAVPWHSRYSKTAALRPKKARAVAGKDSPEEGSGTLDCPTPRRRLARSEPRRDGLAAALAFAVPVAASRRPCDYRQNTAPPLTGVGTRRPWLLPSPRLPS